MLHALERLLARPAGLFAAVLCLVALVVTAVTWWAATGPPATAARASAVPASSGPSPPLVPAITPPDRGVRAGQAAPARPPAPRPPATRRPAFGSSRLSVRSILVGADRRLALVDGRIVGTGDRVGDAVIMAIRARAVELQDASGARRTLELARPAPGAELR